MQSKQNIILIDDDPEIQKLLSEFLSNEGYKVISVYDGSELDMKLKQIRPDLILLDMMLPGEDGVSICRRLVAEDAPPIIMLTAKNDEIDRIVGLEMGADDYVTKPFSPRELLARIRAVLRRTGKTQAPQSAHRYEFEGYIIDLDARQLTNQNGSTVSLTSGEFDLLACFIRNSRRVLSRDQILDQLRGRGAEPFDRTVDMLVSRLRKKIFAVDSQTEIIRTVRNSGYLLTIPVKALK